MEADEFPPLSRDLVVSDVFDLCRAGDWAKALQIADDREAECAMAGDLCLVRAIALKSTKRQREALKILSAASKVEPDRVDLLTLTGMCHRDLAEPERALSCFRRALTVDDTYSKARYQMAVVLQEMGRHGEAAEAFARYLTDKDAQTHALAWSLFGVALRNLKRFNASANAIRKAIALNPDDIPTRNALVITLYQAGETVEAIAAGQEALILKDKVASATFSERSGSLEISRRLVPFVSTRKERNIISFSLWGNNPVYTHGAIVNAQLGPHVYPGWKCRFYCDDSVPKEVRRELVRLGSEVNLIEDEELRDLKPLWRFLASDDPDIDRFICRDADSRLNSHEAVAVDEWTKSNLPFHVMRDHVYHMEVILAGMWGGVARVLPNVRELVRLALSYQRNKWNDQEFLRDTVWPLIRDQAKVHDSVYHFRGACGFPDICRLPGKVHVGGAIKRMPEWPISG